MDWQPIETAPKDGTEIELRIVHVNAKFSKDPEGEGWIQTCKGHWIDHNRGGFTWYGMCGSPVEWRPLTSQENEHETDT